MTPGAMPLVFGGVVLLALAGTAWREARRLERKVSGHVEQVQELDVRPTTPAATIQGPGRYEVQGVLEAAGELLEVPCYERPALWYRHEVVEERFETVRKRVVGEVRPERRIQRRDVVVERTVEVAPALLRDGSGKVLVDLAAGEPEARLVVDRRRPRLIGRLVALLGGVYGTAMAGSLVAAAFDLRALTVFIHLLVPVLFLGVLGMILLIPALLLWKVVAALLPPRVRDRVWVLEPGSPALVVADAIPDPATGALVLGDQGGEGMLVSAELEEARTARLMDEARGLQAGAGWRRLGARLLGVLGAALLLAAAALSAMP